MKKILILIIFFTVVSDVFGQYRRRNNYGRRGGDLNCVICYVEFGAGYYIPSMAYFNEESYLAASGGFSGNIMFYGDVEAKVIENVFFGVGYGFWSETAGDSFIGIGDVLVSDELKMTFNMIDFYGRYEFDVNSFIFHPFIGAGATLNLMNQESSRFVGEIGSEETISGNFLTFKPMAGVKIDLVKGLGLSLEYHHMIGGFDQLFNQGDSFVSERVSTTGPMILGKVSVQLFSRVARDLQHRHKRKRSYRFGKAR
jgi:hypothetical protein